VAAKILMIEDEPGLVLGVGDRLKAEGYDFHSENNGSEGLKRAKEATFDVILLDVMLPGIQGFEILRQIRLNNPTLLVLMLTAKSQIIDKVSGLRLGADDYLTKPFHMEELIARIETLLRRTQPLTPDIVHEPKNDSTEVYRFGPFLLDTTKSQLSMNSIPIDLSYQEYRLLKVFLDNEGKVLTSDVLLNLAWGYESDVTSRTLYVHIAWLRKKLKNPDSPKGYISNRRKIGYVFNSKA